MKAVTWDERKCVLGEGPVLIGEDLHWVDILNNRVLSRNVATGKQGEIATEEHVSFVLPCSDGRLALGTANGPILRGADNDVQPLPGRRQADGHEAAMPTRWNDAKVAPNGDLWLGSMTYDVLPAQAALYRLHAGTLEIERVLSDVTLSNGMGWSAEGTKFYYIDTPTRRVELFDYDGRILNRRRFVDLSNATGMPDGLSVDVFGGVWVAFWEGSQVRRYDESGQLTEIVDVPAERVTSCAFVGTNLIITTATNDEPGGADGLTYICDVGVNGVPTLPFVVG